MSFFGNLFGGGNDQHTTTASTSSTASPPGWVVRAQEELGRIGVPLYQSMFQEGGPSWAVEPTWQQSHAGNLSTQLATENGSTNFASRIADIAKRAYGDVQGTRGAGDQALPLASQTYLTGGIEDIGLVDGDLINRHKSPYMENVIESRLRDLDRSKAEQDNRIGLSDAREQSFGTSGRSLRRHLADEQYGDARERIVAEGEQEAYREAVGLASSNVDRINNTILQNKSIEQGNNAMLDRAGERTIETLFRRAADERDAATTGNQLALQALGLADGAQTSYTTRGLGSNSALMDFGTLLQNYMRELKQQPWDALDRGTNWLNALSSGAPVTRTNEQENSQPIYRNPASTIGGLATTLAGALL